MTNKPPSTRGQEMAISALVLCKEIVILLWPSVDEFGMQSTQWSGTLGAHI